MKRVLSRARVFSSVVTVAAVVAGGVVAVTVAPSVASAAVNPAPVAGARRSATRLPFSVSGTANLSVDAGSGNALFTDRLFTLPGVTGDVPISLYYNSSVENSTLPSAVTAHAGSGWSITGFDQRLVANSDGSVTYLGPGGLTGVFTPNGAGGFVAPVQFRADLKTVAAGGWTLTQHTTGEVLTFTAGGRLSTDKDRNANTTTYTYNGSGTPNGVVSTRGVVVARTLSIANTAGRLTTFTQSDGTQSRTVTLGYDSLGELASVTDLAGGLTSFTDSTGSADPVRRITNPGGAATTLSFTGGKTSQVDQTNTATGSPGTSSTRIEYPSATQTLVADPTTDQASAVSAVPHTTYNLATDGSQLVASATDPNGHARSATYTSLGQVKTSTPAAGGSTSFSYGSNSGESLTGAASPGGAAGSAAYTNTGSNAYLPSSSSDDAGNQLKYTYNGAGNQLTSAQGTGPTAAVTYNSNGTPATSASPGATVSTSYGYDTTANRTSMTPRHRLQPGRACLHVGWFRAVAFGHRRTREHDHLRL